jgi:hypothetical protein
MFNLLADPEKLKEAKLGATLTAYFTGASDKYRAIETELKAYKKQLDELKPLKVQDVLSNLARNTVIIMGTDSAKVISYGDLFAQASSAAQGGGGVTFNGEQAISSALYAMANPDKVKVVFVTGAPQHLLDPDGMFSDMKQVLQDANFDVLEWSPQPSSSPDEPPAGGGPPPASGKGVVWVVFPPESPTSMQMMMMPPNPQPVIDATRKHLAAGGQVLFLAESTANSFSATSYAYADLVKDFGIEVQSKFTTQHEQVQTDPETNQEIRQNSPYVGADMDDPAQFVKHEITTPVQGLPTVFGPLRASSGLTGMNTVVKVLEPVPSGVEAMELVKTPRGPTYWASQDSSPTAKFDKDKDLRSPVSLMAVAVKNKGQKGPEGDSKEQRIAVLGSKLLGANPFQEITVPVLVGGTPYRIPQFPGNAELMKNTVLWLAGYENMIAVSAKADAASRIGSVSATARMIVISIVWVLAPLAPLALLAIVWTRRHRG